MKPRSSGFSLIEMAVVLFVIVLLLGSLLVPLATQVEQRQISDMQKTLDEIREALLGFAVANGYLPCPDTGTNGSENVEAGNTGRCDPAAISGGIAIGRLPYLNLGLGNSDSWGNRFTYLVNEQFARRTGTTYSPFTLSTTGNYIQICATSACVAANKLSTTAIFAVISHGKNGFGAIKLDSGLVNPCPTPPAHPGGCSTDERDNFGTDADLVSRPHFSGGAAASEFDDILTWFSRYTLFNRMIAAGKLP